MTKKWVFLIKCTAAALLILGTLLPSTAAMAHDRHHSDDYIDIIVRYEGEAPSEDELDPAFKNVTSIQNLQTMSVPASSVKAISQQENVERVTYDQEMKTTQTDSSPAISSDDWNQDMIGTFDAWDEDVTGRDVRVAVLDTGFYDGHNDISFAGGHSIFGENHSKGADDWTNDHDGHGTHVASIIGADQHTPAQGIAPNVDLFGVKIYHSEGGNRTNAGSLIAGIQWAIDNNIDIITISSGFARHDEEIHNKIKEADRQGILVIAASGNLSDSKKIIDYPAAYEEVIAVSNVTRDGYRADDSMIADENEFAAPGTNILGLGIASPDSFSNMSGTSQATPHVAGIAALLMEKYPNESAAQIRARMQAKARDMGEAGRDDVYGYGLVHFLEQIIEEEPEEDDTESDNGEDEGNDSDETESDTADDEEQDTEEDPEEETEGEDDESDTDSEDTESEETSETDEDSSDSETPAEDESETDDSEREDDADSEEDETADETDEDNADDEEDHNDQQSTVWIRPSDTNGTATIDDQDISAVADDGVLAISFDSSLSHLERVSLTAEQVAGIRERNITLLIARIDMEWVIPSDNLQEGNALLSFETVDPEMDYADKAISRIVEFSVEQNEQVYTTFAQNMEYRFFTDNAEVNQDALYEWNEALSDWALAGERYTNGGVVGNSATTGTFAVFNPSELEKAMTSESENNEDNDSSVEEEEQESDDQAVDDSDESETSLSAFGSTEGDLPFVFAGAVVILSSVAGGFYFFGGKPKS
ncbi:S8 family serine peptidase [Alkalibacterium sp.]